MAATRRDGKARISAHDRLLGAAAVLFYRDGIAGTGIDAIVKQAGVAKKSLYNNFSSKAELVAAYLQARHEEWLALYAARLQQARGPAARTLAVFDAYVDHAEFAYERGFRGCGQWNAAAELPVEDASRQAIRAYKEEVEALLARHLTEHLSGDAERAAPLARHLAFLLEGAVARAGLEGSSQCLHQARQMAASLLEQW
ncbi:TetR family transcriptional regulator [Kerstersia gyiorum]|uniref:TetR family transcriptional regulator n=1 Tax=Kerstersia gyiorum TaxID=206506 RepID=A0A4V2F199_9BURK|nr:TetR/AcrR family transcriptional regulator [Kerstersia gyiorum]AZV92370.1 TetR family transcriptional regulator [Bordetella sp. J329]KAB0543981.1 TetR/AcrR family transcriptional regulator [Kerstersia gyiorum]RZS72947.1 TetR family transcriptional regulator [Kerstersia gyiorum]